MTFKEVFKFPLKWMEGMVWTSNHNRAFDFITPIHDRNGLFLNDGNQQKIVEAINGDRKIKSDLILEYSPSDGCIYSHISGEPKLILMIRGWGYLTGTGGLNLPEEEASKIQDEFAEYIIKQLQP